MSTEAEDMLDLMVKGIESHIKQHLLDAVVSDLVAEFEKNVTEIVSDKLAEMAFAAQRSTNFRNMQQELAVWIKWCETQADREFKYKMVRSES